MRTLYVIGGGMGNLSLLTKEAENALRQCDAVYAFDRMADLFLVTYPNIQKCSYEKLIPAIQASGEQSIGVLVSGDVGFFSAASKIHEALADEFEIISICGINSVQFLSARLHVPYESMSVFSLHGRNTMLNLLGRIAYNSCTFVLTGGKNNATDILRYLLDKIPVHIKITAAENLSLENERIVSGSIAELAGHTFGQLTVLLFENNTVKRKCNTLFDIDFIRGNVPMTKQEIRWASVGYMDLASTDIIYDIGAGTGSVAVEMAKKAYDGAVFALEKSAEALELIHQNREKHGAYNIIPVPGNAADHLVDLPVPDKAFIGGSGRSLPKIIPQLLERNPKIRIVVNAITLETLTETLAIFKELSLTYQVSCIHSANSRQINRYNLMTANNPVYILSGEKNED